MLHYNDQGLHILPRESLHAFPCNIASPLLLCFFYLTSFCIVMYVCTYVWPALLQDVEGLTYFLGGRPLSMHFRFIVHMVSPCTMYVRTDNSKISICTRSEENLQNFRADTATVIEDEHEEQRRSVFRTLYNIFACSYFSLHLDVLKRQIGLK